MGQLTEVLRGGRQCDEDGVEIIMSRQACHEAADEIERLRGALADIINPIGAMQRDLEDGYQLDGAMAVALANDPEHYKRIARAALTPNAGNERTPLAGGPLD